MIGSLSVSGFFMSSSKCSSSKKSQGSVLLSPVAILVALALLSVLASVTEAAPERNNNRYFIKDESRINRRGFKSSLLSTARGFGKRSDAAAADKDGLGHGMLGRHDVPTYVLAEEAMNNPQMLALLINLVDLDADGLISPREIMRLRD